MPKYQVTGPDGGTYEVTAPEGATEQDAIAYIQAQQVKKVDMPAPGASSLKGSAAGGAFMGLRDAVDAGAQLLRRAVPGGVGRAVDDFGNMLADAGLPVARSSGVAGVDQIAKSANKEYEDSRKLAGRVGIDLARIGGNIANPVNRIVPMAGASALGVAGRAGAQGAISGLATPVLDTENFAGNKAAQVGLGTATGAAGGYLADKAIGALGRGANAARQAMTPRANFTAQADETIIRAAQDQGVDLAAIPESILTGVKKQVADAFASNKTLDAGALLRKAEGDAVLGQGRGLTLGQATRNPQQFAREMNLRGVEGAGAPLAERFAGQNQALVEALNKRGAAAAPGEMAAGQTMIDALRGYDSRLQANVADLYGKARGLNANEIPLDHRAFADKALSVLDSEMKISYLPSQIQGILNGVSKGEIPLNISTSEQIKSTLAEATRAAQRSGDGNTVRALSLVRDALEEARPATELGDEAQAAFNAARAAARERFGKLNTVPALKAAADDMAPDKFFQKHVLGATARDFDAMLKLVPDQADTIRTQTLDYLKSRALGGASDEVGKFSQSAYNKALKSIGDTKLLAMFPPEEVAALKSIGRVAAYIQAQPAGSAVNSSNTGAAVMNLLSQMSGKLGSFPGLNIARNSINQFVDERAAANALAGQVPAQAKEAPVNALRPLLLPYAGGGGLLGAYMAQ